MTWWSGCELVVFDLDDTLYLERDYVRSGFIAVGRWTDDNLGTSGFGDRCWALFEAGVRNRTFDLAFEHLGVDPPRGTVDELVDRYRAHVPDISILDDAAVALRAIHQEGLQVGVLTDGPVLSQRAKATAVGAFEWAGHVVLTGELAAGCGKPHPAGFRELERVLGCTGPQCLYVGDNPSKDFGGPRSLGWRTLRVRRPGSLHVEVDSGADVDTETVGLGGPVSEDQVEVAAVGGTPAV